jgi:hypothetical protein
MHVYALHDLVPICVVVELIMIVATKRRIKLRQRYQLREVRIESHL